MIKGSVNFNEARIRLKVIGKHGREQVIEAVIDTGYSSSLTLPPSLIAQLGLSWQDVGRAELADGNVCVFDVFEAQVIWDGKIRKITVDESDADSLVGMKLLRGHELKMQVRSRGKVTIKRLR